MRVHSAADITLAHGLHCREPTRLGFLPVKCSRLSSWRQNRTGEAIALTHIQIGRYFYHFLVDASSVSTGFPFPPVKVSDPLPYPALVGSSRSCSGSTKPHVAACCNKMGSAEIQVPSEGFVHYSSAYCSENGQQIIYCRSFTGNEKLNRYSKVFISITNMRK